MTTLAMRIFIISNVVLLCLAVTSCWKHDEGPKSHLEGNNSTEIDSHFNHYESHFEKLKNLTDQEKEKFKSLKLCGSLFHPEGSKDQFVATCFEEMKGTLNSDSEEDDKPLRKRRDTFIKDVDYNFNSVDDRNNLALEDNNINDDIYENIKPKLRPRRQSVSVRPKRGPWNPLDNPHVRKNPCIVSCVLEKQGLINSTGGLDIEGVLERVENLLSTANTTEPKMIASKIVNICIAQQQEMDDNQKLAPEDDPNRLQCKAIVQISKCLSRDVFIACRNGYGTANLVRNSAGKSDHNK